MISAPQECEWNAGGERCVYCTRPRELAKEVPACPASDERALYSAHHEALELALDARQTATWFIMPMRAWRFGCLYSREAHELEVTSLKFGPEEWLVKPNELWRLGLASMMGVATPLLGSGMTLQIGVRNISGVHVLARCSIFGSYLR